MGVETVQDWQKTVAGALEWWRDAGVDMLVEDVPRDWLARPATRAEAAVAVAEAVAAAQPAAEALPDTLEAFLEWRFGPAAPEAEWLTPLARPEGPSDADWVVLTDAPEGDALIDGPAGRLFDRMLAAIGLSRDSIYLMSLAAARPLTGRIPPDQEARLGELARHHLALIRPKKLLMLGLPTTRALAETEKAGVADRLHLVNHFDCTTEVVATYHPRFLMERPVAKSEAWKHLLLLSRGPSK